jgi:hypothetical protein
LVIHVESPAVLILFGSLKKKKYFPGRRRIMKLSAECQHRPIHEIESKLYPDYDDGLYQRMYIELEEEV